MSHVIASFRSSVGVAAEAPLHAVIVLVVTLAASVLGLALGLIPIVGPIVSGVLVTPLMLAAVLGSANATRLGDHPFDGLKRGLGDAGVSLVGAFGLLYAGYLAVSIVVTLGAVVVIALTIGIGGSIEPGLSTALGSAMGLVFVLFFLVVLVAILLLGLVAQFVGPAAVVAGTGAVDSLGTSYRFFRRNLRGVLGFSAVVFGVVLLAYAVAAVAFGVGYLAVSEVAGFAMGGVAYLLAFALVGAILTVYQVTYFDAVVDESVLPEADDDPVSPRDGDGSTAPDDDAAGGATDRNSTHQTGAGSDFEFGGSDGDDENLGGNEGTRRGTDSTDRDSR